MTQNKSIFAQRLSDLRSEMEKEGVDGYIVPRTDEYQGEYVADYAERLKWLTGFSGSAGVAVILKDRAIVMSDGRYTIQLDQQIDKSCYHAGDNTKIPVGEWLGNNANKNDTIGFDFALFTPAQIENIQKLLMDSGISLVSISDNLVDRIWSLQPEPPMRGADLFPDVIAGATYIHKLDMIAMDLRGLGADAVVITLSDSIAWLLNIRGHDVAHIPVCLSYLIVYSDGRAQWFVEEQKISHDVGGALSERVDFFPPRMLLSILEKMGEKGRRVLIDPKRSAIRFHEIVKNAGGQVIDGKDPCIDARAIKTDAELASMKMAHIRDGVAIVKFLKWVEAAAQRGDQDELSVEGKLQHFRAQADEWREPSFDTIAGFNGNGAIVHYRASEATNQTISAPGILLLDSGAQYADGTTDITRTLSIGEASDEIRMRSTLVLKGHIGLARTVFDADTRGKDLDAIARAPLKAQGLDYAHGTGHGVGCYLSVHEEAAMGISPRAEMPLQAGMIISNEPGYYEEGAYGIRHENLVLVKDAGAGKLCFETITLAPFDMQLVDTAMLDDGECAWLNEYHTRVFETLSPLLDAEHQAWLKEACEVVA